MPNHYYLPSYMPTNEDDLMKWFDNYFKTLPAYVSTFQIETQDMELQQGILTNIETSRSVIHSLQEYRKAMTELKNQLLHGAKNGMVPVPQPENIGIAQLSMIGGLVKLVDEQNKTHIFNNPAYNDTIGKELGLLPIQHPEPQPGELVAAGTAGCNGKELVLFCHIVKPASSYSFSLDKSDGKGMVYQTSFEEAHQNYGNIELPLKEELWTVRYALRVRGGEVGTAAYLNVRVKRT